MSGRPLGLVLCGGRSARMGRDKALLPWPGSDLLDHAIARLREATPDVALLCGPATRYVDRGVPIVVDAPGGEGASAGLEAGLAWASGRPVLLLAVDLPLVPRALLRALADAITPGSPSDRPGPALFDAVVPVSPRGPEPLCAAYGPACLPALRARLAHGDRGMKAFWPDVRLRALDAAALAAFGDPESMFLNVNEPDDLDHAARLASTVS